ncbi:YaiI/YqxD family protein [Jeotgalibacillus soli]|nr:DUF188 domain-containing protein [Jeotgalibacillus soli]
MDRQSENVMLFIDADACPKEIREVIERLAAAYNIHCQFVASYQHFSLNADKRYWTFIDDGREAVDLFILNNVQKGDLVITQDIGLASLALSKGVYAFSTRGTEYREENIDTSLSFRYLYQVERKKGRYGGGPKKITSQDIERFSVNLNKFLIRHAGNE